MSDSERLQEEIFPFNWEGWDEQDVLKFIYYDVEFTDDFGDFKKDDKFSTIFVDYEKGLIEAYNEEGKEVLKKQNFKAIAI